MALVAPIHLFRGAVFCGANAGNMGWRPQCSQVLNSKGQLSGLASGLLPQDNATRDASLWQGSCQPPLKARISQECFDVILLKLALLQ
eukprot:2819805-Amphidinium_carterae.1